MQFTVVTHTVLLWRSSFLIMAVLKPKFVQICDGIPGSEGPVFDTKGNLYAVSPMNSKQAGKTEFRDGISGQLHRIDPTTGKNIAICTPHVDGYGGRPAGCQCDREGNIWIADMRLGILKYTPGSGCVQISKIDTDGRALNGCNDLVFDINENLWVTGPGSPIAPAKEDRTTIFQGFPGVLYCLPKGEFVPRKITGEAFAFCNGIAVREDLLLVAETMTRRIIAFDIIAPGQVKNKREWAKLPEATYDDPMKIGGPDGMDFDVTGRLLVAHHGGGHLEVFSSDGELENRIQCPFKTPSNLHFAPGSKTCFVTEHDKNGVWKFDWECSGMPMYCDI